MIATKNISTNTILSAKVISYLVAFLFIVTIGLINWLIDLANTSQLLLDLFMITMGLTASGLMAYLALEFSKIIFEKEPVQVTKPGKQVF